MMDLDDGSIYRASELEVTCQCVNCGEAIEPDSVFIIRHRLADTYEMATNCHGRFLRHIATGAEWRSADSLHVLFGSVEAPRRNEEGSGYETAAGEWDEQLEQSVLSLIMNAEAWNAVANGNLTTSPTITLTMPEPKIAEAVGSANLRSPSPPKRKGRWLHL